MSAMRRHLPNTPTHVAAQNGVFDAIYRSNHWGGEESRSGTGSSLAQTRIVREALPQLLKRLNCQSVLDAPCGDFHWLSQIELDVDYIGFDIVDEIVLANRNRYASTNVRFAHGDITSTKLPRVDLILCRDGLVHLSYADIFLALRNFLRSGARYLLTTTFPGRANTDIATGGWRPLDFQQRPFEFPPPDDLINERCTEFDGAYPDKSLGLWDMSRW
jgi:SAM-dependent methyltransferase